jgi:hypothetical protein
MRIFRFIPRAVAKDAVIPVRSEAGREDQYQGECKQGFHIVLLGTLCSVAGTGRV